VRQPGPESTCENKNLQPKFVGEPLSVGFWAAIFYDRHTPLITLRKRTENEKKNENNKLGFDSHQYTHEILIPHLLPFYRKSSGFEGVETIEDGTSYHFYIYDEISFAKWY
jgi:hypothetical protein